MYCFEFVGKWKKNAFEFEMSVMDDGKGSRYIRIPKPLDEILGQPENIKFSIKGKKIIMLEN